MQNENPITELLHDIFLDMFFIDKFLHVYQSYWLWIILVAPSASKFWWLFVFILNKVLEQILGVLIKLVKDLKLEHQHKYVRVSVFPNWFNCCMFTFSLPYILLQNEMQKTWLCKRCETMNAKLRYHLILYSLGSKFLAIAVVKISYFSLREGF